MENVMKALNVIINAMCLVEQPYYNLETTYEPNGIVRERVFCYELYHKMRLLMEQNKELRLSLNGEIDKRGHLCFEIEDQKNPDFVFHVPGQMGMNTIVIEIKGKASGVYIEKCIKDFDTLIVFVSKYQYKLGVFILYNYYECPKQLVNRLRGKFASYDVRILKRIVILCKQDAETGTQVTTLFEIIKND